MHIAIDIGGTNTRVALFIKNKLIKILKAKTKKNDFNKAMNEINGMINEFNVKGIEGIGISAPGPADFKKGIMGLTPNLPDWNKKNIIKTLFKLTGISNIKMQNDANLMALAHHYDFNNLGKITQFFTISTGLGAGLIINDQIFTGNQGLAHEVAYAPTAWSKERGKNLSEGSLELFSSGSGIESRTGVEAAEVFRLYNENEKFKLVINDGIETLANMIATSCALIDPALIVFDGPIARHHKWYIKKAIAIAKTRTVPGQFKNISFKFGKLGDDAGLYGAHNLILKK